MPTRHLLAAAAIGAVVLLPAGAAFAAPSPGCEAYSNACVSPSRIVTSSPSPTSGTAVLGEKFTQLPFTGGEIVLMTVAGLIALGGGVTLVLATRRRGQHA